MGKKVLFWPDVYMEQGHWLPTVVWANGLISMGHTVNYMGIRDCASVVSPFGYTENQTGSDKGKYTVIFEDLYPLGYTRTSQSSINERWKPDHIFSIANGELDALFTGANKPDLLVSGYFTSLESLLIHYKYGIKVVITTTYLRHPQDDPAIRATQNLMGFPRPVARKLMQDVMGVKWDESYEIEDFVSPLESFDELIPCPFDMEFEHYNPGDLVHYVEPCITPSDYQSHAEFWGKLPYDKAFIYATAGSQVQDYEKKAEYLFGQLINMMNSPQMTDYHLILGVGPALAKKDWGASPLYTVCSWVPQRDLLDRSNTAVALIHGGLATIKECIYYDKPFVVLPMGKDQMDNGLRLKQKGVAQIAYAERSDTQSLLHAINTAITDHWSGSKRTKMKNIFRSYEDSQRPGLQILANLLSA